MVKRHRVARFRPVSYMKVFDQSCATVESTGARRGASNGRALITRTSGIHPRQRTPATCLQFNGSVGVFDDPMQQVESDGLWELAHAAQPEAKEASG